MNIIPTELAGLLLIEPKAFGDARGFFFESYQRERYLAAGITADFVQDQPPPALRSARLRPRLLCDERLGRCRLQMYRLLRAR